MARFSGCGGVSPGANWNHETDAPYQHIGTYPQEALADVAEGTRVDIIGKVGTCERLSSDSHVFMALGYCHHFSGPFLRVARILKVPDAR